MKLDILQPNDIVDVISPATPVSFLEAKKIENFLKKIKLVARVPLRKALALKKRSSDEFASFSASRRFEQLKEAIENDESKILLRLID